MNDFALFFSEFRDVFFFLDASCNAITVLQSNSVNCKKHLTRKYCSTVHESVASLDHKSRMSLSEQG